MVNPLQVRQVVNPSGYMRPTANPQSVADTVIRGQERRENQNIRQQERAENQQQRDMEREEQKRERAYEQMAADPVNAAKIAEVSGIEYTPQMAELFQNKELASMTIQGAKMAKAMGISNPETAQAFVRRYIDSKGNILDAQDSIQGMELGKPERPQKPSYSHIKKVGDDLIDVRDGSVIYKGEGSQSPYDPLKDANVPFELRMRGKALMENEYSGVPDENLGGKTPMDVWLEQVGEYAPKQQQAVDEWAPVTVTPKDVMQGSPAPNPTQQPKKFESDDDLRGLWN